MPLKLPSLAEMFGVPRGKSAKQRACDKVLQRERGLDLAALAKAKKLAGDGPIEIDRDGPNAYWVICPVLDPDPLDGANFCRGGREVLDAVQFYLAAIAAPKP